MKPSKPSRLCLTALILAALMTWSAPRAVHALSPITKTAPSGKEQKSEKIPTPKAKLDPLDRSIPRGTVQGFMTAGQRGDTERALLYLDLSRLPRISREKKLELANELYVGLSQGLLIDYDQISDQPGGMSADELPKGQDRVGFIMLPERVVDITVRRAKSKRGRPIWLFSPSTVAAAPEIYRHYKPGALAQFMGGIFPAWVFLGVLLWQWVLVLVLLSMAYALARGLTAVVKAWLLRRRPRLSGEALSFLRGPLTLFIALLMVRPVEGFLAISMEGKALMKANTLFVIVGAWTAVSILSIVAHHLKNRLAQSGREDLLVVMRPSLTVLKVLIIMTASLMWLDNVGFKVTTILASLGIGGIAVALAAQDTLKNVFGSLAILLDKPFLVGERIVAQGHDGFVEEIGLRSTKLRLLDGNQAVVPNETMARVDINNIGRRPHIRQISDIGIAYDTPVELVDQAVKTIEEIMHDHQGMHPDWPPRIYFNAFNPYALNIKIIYWYHPPNYWDFMAYNHELNLSIMRAFEEKGIQFAYPTTTFLASDPRRPLDVSWPGEGGPGQ